MNCIEQWKKIILYGNTNKLNEIIHKNATFYSPVVFTPQVGKRKVINYLSNAVNVFHNKGFSYKKTITNQNSTFAEFEATFGKILVNGIDLIITKNNLIYEFKVFLRPLKGLEVVWKEMGKKLEI